MSDDDRQLAELHQHERYSIERRQFHEAIDRRIRKMERDVERGSALQRILKAERQAAIPGELELEHEHEH